MDYQYWNDFVNDWLNGSFKLNANQKVIRGWRKPKYKMACFLPEPWWGNNGKDTLYSVVVNLNPGKGGPSQKHDSPQIKFYCNHVSDYTYQSLMASKLKLNLPKTENWHQNKRAKPMISALRIYHGPQIFCQEGNEMKHHLSVELIPWHTEKASEAYAYIDENAKAIVDYSIAFAAKQSLRIPKNVRTHGKVFVRMRWPFFENILINAHEPYQIISPVMPSLNSGWKLIIFRISKFKGVTFYCLWNANNILPESNILVKILHY